MIAMHPPRWGTCTYEIYWVGTSTTTYGPDWVAYSEPSQSEPDEDEDRPSPDDSIFKASYVGPIPSDFCWQRTFKRKPSAIRRNHMHKRRPRINLARLRRQRDMRAALNQKQRSGNHQ